MSKGVLITGCSSGIGLIAAQDLHNRGYRVLAACRKPQDVEHMHQLGLEGIELDLDDSASVGHAAEQVIAMTGGKRYALFNNGGFAIYGALSSISRRQMEQQFATNLFGTHQLTQLLPAMLPHCEGHIIQTSSVMGLVSDVRGGTYVASKFALEAWFDALSMELHSSGIQVSIIEPGPISTHFSQNTNQAQSDQEVHNCRIFKNLSPPPQAILPKLHHAL